MNIVKEYQNLTSNSYKDKNGKSYSYVSMISLLKKTDSNIPKQDNFASTFDESMFLRFKQDINNFYETVKLFSLEMSPGRTLSWDLHYYTIAEILLFNKNKVISLLKNPKNWKNYIGKDLVSVFVLLKDISKAYKELSENSDCCHIKTTKKYTSRPGPPYAANEPCCQNKQKVGNDSNIYVSTRSRNGIWRWKKI